MKKACKKEEQVSWREGAGRKWEKDARKEKQAQVWKKKGKVS